MPTLTDLSRVRAILDRDRPWAAYAIGDLSPDLAGRCSWYASNGSDTLVLLYRGLAPPIAVAIGAAAEAAPLFRELDAPEISLQVRPEILAAIEPAYRPTALRRMWRMVVEPSSFRPASTAGVIPLDASQLDTLEALYAEGGRHGDGGAVFHTSMLERGRYYGIWEGGDLIAAAGTHLYAPALGVCAVGNVYTRADRRRRGLAARTTSAVVADAVAHGIATIVLSVRQENVAARRVYERLGFRCHCEFIEGTATRRHDPGNADTSTASI